MSGLAVVLQGHILSSEKHGAGRRLSERLCVRVRQHMQASTETWEEQHLVKV